MTNHTLALGSALYSRLSSGTIPVYYYVAPQNTKPPYGIIQSQSPGIDDYVFGSTDTNTVECYYTIKVISKDVWPSIAWGLYNELDSLIQGYTLSPTGYTSLRCERNSTIEYQDREKFWHCGSIFKIELEKGE